MRPASHPFAQEAARLCAERGALLIVDEVQTGFGRTGTLFAIEQYGIAPDILCLAKSIAGGMPMGAIAFSRKVGDLAKRSHSTTFGGNPLACAAAIAAIGEIRRKGLVENARERGRSFRTACARSEATGFARCAASACSSAWSSKRTQRARSARCRMRVLALGAGPTVVRFLPPLVISDSEIDRVLAASAKALG